MVRRALLGLIILDVPFCWDIHLGYHLDPTTQVTSFPGWCLSVTTLALAGLYAGWLPQLALRATQPRCGLLFAVLPLAIYVILLALSILVAHHRRLACFELFVWLQMLLLFLYVAGTLRADGDLRFVIAMLLLGLIVQGLLIIGVSLRGQGFSALGLTATVDIDPQAAFGSTRTGGTIGSPNVAGSYLSLLLAPALAVLISPLSRRYKWLAAMALAAGTVALIFTYSRGAWIASAVSLSLFGWLTCARGWLAWKPFAGGALLLSLIAVSFSGQIYARAFHSESSAAYSRIPLMKLAWRMIGDHPLMGVGANNFAVDVWQYVRPEFSGEFVSAVHNKYLLVWAETGIVGLVLFLWFFTANIRRGLACWQHGEQTASLLVLGLTTGLIGQLIHMNVDIFSSRPQLQMWCLLAGIISATDLVQSSGREVQS